MIVESGDRVLGCGFSTAVCYLGGCCSLHGKGEKRGG